MSELESVELPSAPTSTEKTPEREGLPPNYRMRADAHYVDQLTSRRPDRPQPRRDQPERDGAGEPRYRRGDRVFAELSENIATIQSAATLLAAETSPIARRVSLDLIRAHAWRAGWLFRAHQLLDGLHRTHVRPRPIGTILTQVRDHLSAECRLTSSHVSMHCADWNATVEVDEDVLVTGIAGGILATLEMTSGGDAIAIDVSAIVDNSELRSVEIVQHGLRVPGNWTASLGATVAKSSAHLMGGEAVFLAGDKRGSTVRFNF